MACAQGRAQNADGRGERGAGVAREFLAGAGGARKILKFGADFALW